MITTELTISIGANLVVIAFFAGIYVCTVRNHDKAIENLQKNQKDVIANLQEYQDKMIKALKEYFNEKIVDMKEGFAEHLQRVEEKQDKHNNLVERTFCCEKEISVLKEQIKVENHRIEDLEEVQHECFRNR